ncbi:MAG: FecR domain-containing protein, partial [Firmicutes bacterium]|nr:FecR domain-containing protein [Bacillota bacterium]
MKTKKIIAFLLVLCLTLGSAACVFAADSQGSANAVTLEEFTGTIKVTNASGKDVSARNGMRLYSGYTVSTGTDSNAYIALDETKALMLESSSKTILKKSGGKIDVMLESGTVVVDVSKSLKKNQTLNVHTTNMVTGIRGTGVEVSYFSRISTTRICMLDGSTQNFNKFGLGEVQVVDAGHGIALGGGAATVEVLGDSIAVADLQPETQRLMVVDGGISGDVLEGFNEAFGTGELSEEDAAELQAAVGAAVEEQAAEQQAVEAAAEASAKDALTAETTGTAITNVDPVFEDQSAATGTGATMNEETSSGDSGYVPADTGSNSSGDSGSSGDETLSSDAVTFTVPSGDNFASVMVFIDDVKQDSPEVGSSATYTATPSSVKFQICYDEDGMGYSVDNVTAKLGSTSLDVTSAPSQYDNVSGKFFAKSELPDNATLSAEIELTVEKINDDNASAVTGTLSSLASLQIFSA